MPIDRYGNYYEIRRRTPSKSPELMSNEACKRVEKLLPTYKKMARSKVIKHEFSVAEIVDVLWAGKDFVPKKVWEAMLDYASGFSDDRITKNESILACGLRHMNKNRPPNIPAWAKSSRSWKPI